MRNPRRTAATASALMVGLALVSAFTIIGASTNASVDQLVDDALGADFVVSTAVGQPFTTEVADELAQVDGVAGVKQSNEDELQLIDGLEVFAGNDDILARTLDLGGAGGICVSSHVVGPDMKRLFEEPERRAEIDASLQDVYAAMFVTASPAPVKAALTLLGHRVGGLRLPLVECDEQELQVVRDALANHGLLSTSRPTTPDRTAA
jgi:4-hydroxy-tetrahydrodipicolinate synthase